MRMLVAIEDKTLGEQICSKFAEAGFIYDWVTSAEDAEFYFDKRHYALILSSLAMAKGEGLLSQLQSQGSKSAMIVLSESDDSSIEIESLNLGADDYLRIPFDADVLMARIKKALQHKGFDNRPVYIAGLEINLEENQVSYQGKAIELMGKPLEVFAYFARYPEQIITKEQLLSAIWIEPELVTPNVIDVAVNQIRQKIDKPFGIQTIESVARRGYRFSFPQ
ncbi:MAG TPA: response regulator transcription factor [Thiomicrospira sp.]|nr:response regulator transcription factor [Thiomicrospira sp.]